MMGEMVWLFDGCCTCEKDCKKDPFYQCDDYKRRVDKVLFKSYNYKK